MADPICERRRARHPDAGKGEQPDATPPDTQKPPTRARSEQKRPRPPTRPRPKTPPTEGTLTVTDTSYGLYDEDPADQLAAEIAAYHLMVCQTLRETRERYVAVAVARLMGENDYPALMELDAHFGRIDDPHLLREMLGRAIWDGSRSVEREARTRLLRLRDANDVRPVLEAMQS